MKSLLVRTLLLYRTKDEGFTIPMVIGLGLIMILLGSVALVQSSEENLIALSKKSSSSSLAMAELGIARYRELLNNNRVLAVYSLANWTSVADETCDVITDVSGGDGWANTTDWRSVVFDEDDPNPLIPPIDLNDDDDTDDTDVEIGSYRIVNYVYQNDANPGVDGDFGQVSDTDNTGNPRGILTVQGRTSDGVGMAQIEVTIPIGVNTDDLNTLDPAIWIHESTPASLGTITFQDGGNDLGNLVLYRDGTDRCASGSISGIEYIRDPRELPPMTELPGSANLNTFDGADLTSNTTNPKFENNELILGKVNTLKPPTVSTSAYADDFERYYYRVNGDLVIADGQSLLADGTAKVIIHVTGNLNVGNNVTIGNTSDDATSSFFEIYVSGQVIINGDANINALIRAENSVDPAVPGINIVGSTTVVNLAGSMWTSDLNNGGTINVVRDLDNGEDAYKYYSTTLGRTPKPLTYAPTGWERQEAQ